MRYATVCSGIGAPEAAWADIWGPPVFTSEIEPFPSAVLKHHYPDVPNYGDMTNYKEWPDHDIDVLIGGTPCQAFSVAGLRRSLDDERGNLTLTFLGIARRYQPRFTVWENVPGVLNTSDNAFGQFLSGLTGFDTELHPTGGRWTSSGFIIGPERVAAWIVKDAQYFGVPQRRRRVFVIASPRNLGFAPCQVLFEPESMRGNPPKGRKKGEGVASDVENGVKGGHRFGQPVDTTGFQGDRIVGDGDIFPSLSAQDGQGNAEICKDGSPSLTCNHEAPILSVHARQDPISSDKALPLESKGGEQAIAIQDGRGMEKGQNGLGIDEGGPSYTLDQTGGQAVAFKVRCGCEGGGKGYLGSEDKTFTVATTHDQDIFHNSIVRRLTPVECERLQGFPDSFTKIPWRGKPASSCPDGPRYKALGNSMAVPVVRWIGRRIQMWEDTIK